MKFVFDHPVIDKTGLTHKQQHWYLQGEWYSTPWDGSQQIEFCIQLFERPSVVKAEYSWEQIEEGLRFLNNEIVLYLLHDTNLPWPKRKKLIESMKDLFSQLLKDNPISTCRFMWWDGLCYDYYLKKGVAENEDDLNVQNTIFDTLKGILNIESLRCQVAALHGIGHLMHKETTSVINGFLEKHSDLPKHIQEYAKACIKGKMDPWEPMTD